MASVIPRDFIDLLLSKIDIVDLVNSHVSLRKKSNNNYFACCPFHQEKSASFSVSQSKQFYHCFGCGAHGNAIDFMMQMDRLNFPEAIESLAKTAGLDVPRQDSKTSKKTEIASDLYDFMQEMATHYYEQMKQSNRAIDYLKNRAISGQIAKHFSLGYAPSTWDHLLSTYGKTNASKQILLDVGLIIQKEDGRSYDRFRDRIVFPIHDYRGRVIGFGGRVIDEGEPKYLNSPETILFQKGHELYGLHHALKANRKLPHILIVEGYMDVIALFQHGITYAVATLGTATTSHHLQRLFRYTKSLVFCFDGDKAGRTAAWRGLQVLLPLLQDDLSIRFLFLPENEDPDSLIRKAGKDSFENMLQNAQSLSDFFFQTLAKERDIQTAEGRASFAKEALNYIDQVPVGLFQQILRDELKVRARIDIPTLRTKSTFPSKKMALRGMSPPQNPLECALALLIQTPMLAHHIDQALPAPSSKGLVLLHQIIDIVKNQAECNTAKLIEHWRGEEDEAMIAKLATYPYLVPEAGILSEFLGALRQVMIQSLTDAIQALLAKAANQLLSPDEKNQLTNYIAEKNALCEVR